MNSLEYPFDAEKIIRRKIKIKNELILKNDYAMEKRIAVLGGSTTHDIIAVLDIFLLNFGIKCEFYESEYGKYWEDIIFDNKDLDDFKPDLFFVHTTNRNISRYPDISDSKEDVESLLEKEFIHYKEIWERISKKYGCPIIQNNFEPLPYRLLGNRDIYDYRGHQNFLNCLNNKFYSYAEEHNNLYINDLNYISSCYGLDKWTDLNAWYLYKYAMAVKAIPFFSYNVALIIKAIYGKNKKALVLDLDNTLWGGVIGDDGLSGIEIGHETAVAEAYTEFQQYVKRLKNMGVLLNINSKNEIENALLGLAHPQSTLKKEDFLIIKANWENKDRNINKIAEELNIGADSLVFVDDNPAERELVRNNTDGVAVPELDSIDSFVRIIDRMGCFEVVSLTEDDLKRNMMYKNNIFRNQEETHYHDYEEYLLSLDMRAEISCFNNLYIQRITQLINKTNQFNLTTKRYTVDEIQKVMSDHNYITQYCRLTDKFGDNGIVSCMIGKIENEDLSVHIELWIMSCRVLKRNVEYLMFDKFIETASMLGIKTIHGHYYETEKNHMVSNLYSQLGFRCCFKEEDRSDWKLEVEEYKHFENCIKCDNSNK